MGRVTQVTKDIQYSWKPVGIVNKHNNDKSGKFDYPDLNKGNLWGGLSVKDLNENNHKIIFGTRDEQTENSAHIEELLFGRLENFINSTAAGLSRFKVIFYIDQSPCSDCCNQMIARCGRIAELVPDGAYIDFSFVYRNLYAIGVASDKRHNLFASGQSALNEYARLSKTYSSDTSKTEFKIRIRNVANTK